MMRGKQLTRREKMKQAIEAINRESVKRGLKVSEVMQEAWYLAKLIASEFQLSPKALLSAALKRVWKAVRVRVSIKNAYEKRAALAKIGFTFNEKTKAWEKEMLKAESTGKKAIRFGKGFIKNFGDFIESKNIKIRLIY